MTDEISIVTPAYKAEQSLAGAVKSVIGQSHDDWELLIVSDDGLDYEAVLRAAGLSDSRCRFLTTGRIGSGASNARNQGLSSRPRRPYVGRKQGSEASLAQTMPPAAAYSSARAIWRERTGTWLRSSPVGARPGPREQLVLEHRHQVLAHDPGARRRGVLDGGFQFDDQGFAVGRAHAGRRQRGWGFASIDNVKGHPRRGYFAQALTSINPEVLLATA